jgi:hypothetical protein
MVTVSIEEELLLYSNGYNGSRCLLQLTPKFCLSRTKVTHFRSSDINLGGDVQSLSAYFLLQISNSLKRGRNMATEYSKFLLYNDAFGVETVMLDAGLTEELTKNVEVNIFFSLK